MELQFSKYQASGNNFVAINMMSTKRQLTPELQRRICDVKTGIGADGTFTLEESTIPGCVYRVVYFPANGRVGELCGNASVCSLPFAEQIGLAKLEGEHSEILFEAYDGVHRGGKLSPDSYFISLKDIPLKDIRQVDDQTYFVDMCTPHLVQFVDDVAKVEIYKVGRDLQKRTDRNIDFVQVDKENEDNLTLRALETGVESETSACGTGATVSSIVSFLRPRLHDFKNSGTWNGQQQASGTRRVSMRGGQLKVTFSVNEQTVSDIRLSGCARHVFDGTMLL